MSDPLKPTADRSGTALALLWLLAVGGLTTLVYLLWV